MDCQWDTRTHPISHHVLEELVTLLKKDNDSFTILLTGPEGAGKGSIAASIASTMAGDSSQLDVEHLQSPGEGIKMIHQVKTFLACAPIGGSRRVVILEDVDTLSIPAQNALLKLLEEPPSRCAIVLTTSHASHLLPTIRSRCFKIRVPAPGISHLTSLLASQRGLSIPDAETLARWSSGRIGRAFAISSDRDWQTTLQRMIITVAELSRHSITKRLEWVESVYLKNDGNQMPTWLDPLEILSTWWRDILLIKLNRGQSCTNQEMLSVLQEGAKQIPTGEIIKLLLNIAHIKSLREEGLISNKDAMEWTLLLLPTQEKTDKTQLPRIVRR